MNASADRWPSSFYAALTATFADRPRRNEPLSSHTTARLGGPADVWLPVNNVQELVSAVTIARQQQVPTVILGSGANILITDAGVRGLVIENRAGQVRFPVVDENIPSAIITAESGVVLPSLARRCVQRGLGGFEWAIGVPGTIGGAVVNNAGAYDGDMAANLVRAELLSATGERTWQLMEWFQYDYRTSRLKQQRETGWVVLQADLKLVPTPAMTIQAKVNAFNERRKSSQPPGATMGSMFKNPPGNYAGRLIDAAGLKGYQAGQARVSTVHANFFRNLGGATAADMLALIDAVQTTVAEKFDVELELEIEVIGERSS